MTGHWIAPQEFAIDDYLGFIYKITSKSGHFYIGRKTFWSTITKPPLKGAKRKRKITKESEWRTYTSSSRELNELIVKQGIENFKFEILHLCTSKSELSYYECYHIVVSGAMTSDLGLNYNISKVPTKPKPMTKKTNKKT